MLPPLALHLLPPLALLCHPWLCSATHLLVLTIATFGITLALPSALPWHPCNPMMTPYVTMTSSAPHNVIHNMFLYQNDSADALHYD